MIRRDCPVCGEKLEKTSRDDRHACPRCGWKEKK